MKLRAVGYVRVSTEEQVRGGISLNLQHSKIHAYAELEGFELVEIISDEGISGSSIKGRPSMKRVLDLARNHQIDCIVTWKLDRLARNTSESLDIATLCQKNGVALHSITEKLDTQSALGKFFFTLMASLAEMERSLIGNILPLRSPEKEKSASPQLVIPGTDTKSSTAMSSPTLTSRKSSSGFSPFISSGSRYTKFRNPSKGRSREP